MYLKPSEINYCQDSISCRFHQNCAHYNTYIGETLDALCEGRISINSIPTITVVRKDDKWYTADNRRLWVFRHLERLGKCDEIPVIQGRRYALLNKFTNYNGNDAFVRGKPRGKWYLKPTVQKHKHNSSSSVRASTTSRAPLRSLNIKTPVQNSHEQNIKSVHVSPFYKGPSPQQSPSPPPPPAPSTAYTSTVWQQQLQQRQQQGHQSSIDSGFQHPVREISLVSATGSFKEDMTHKPSHNPDYGTVCNTSAKEDKTREVCSIVTSNTSPPEITPPIYAHTSTSFQPSPTVEGRNTDSAHISFDESNVGSPTIQLHADENSYRERKMSNQVTVNDSFSFKANKKRCCCVVS